MLHNILAIARVTCLDLWTRRVGAAYVGIALVFFGLSGTFNVQVSHGDGMNNVSTYSALGMGSFGLRLAQLLALYVAAKSVDLEVQQRTLSAVMIRPVARHAYLLGRLTGGIAAFVLFLLAAVAFSTAVNLKNGTPTDPGMPWAMGTALVSTLTWTAILLPLAAITSFPACVGLLVTAQVAGWFVGMVPARASPWVPYLKDAFYYLSPMELPPELNLQTALPVAASLAYGAALFAACAAIFARQDLRLR